MPSAQTARAEVLAGSLMTSATLYASIAQVIVSIMAGEHRHLGMHITRVRSCKIDNWTAEELDVIQSIGNQRASAYWEGKKSKGGFNKPTSDASAQQRRSFIKEKYVKKVWVDESVGNPFEIYMKAVEQGKNP